MGVQREHNRGNKKERAREERGGREKIRLEGKKKGIGFTTTRLPLGKIKKINVKSCLSLCLNICMSALSVCVCIYIREYICMYM